MVSKKEAIIQDLSDWAYALEPVKSKTLHEKLIKLGEEKKKEEIHEALREASPKPIIL
ncbi:MAG: hypothetical protein ABIB71_07855 [Candidatus Woesearchaeota archaeon]